VYHYDTLDKSDDMWNSGASTGPASDGRIKPTFTFFYDDILTTSSSGPTSYTSTFGGTSGATPIIAGHVGLFFQMWSEGIFGNPVDPEVLLFMHLFTFSFLEIMELRLFLTSSFVIIGTFCRSLSVLIWFGLIL